MADLSREEFLEHLHDALNHLYNADQLRRSPLASLFGVSDRFDTSAVLRKLLTEAIEALKPPASEHDSSKAWRTYESLYCCFIQQLNQQVVADQLCISARQLRREQRNALENLADALWQKYALNVDRHLAGSGDDGAGAAEAGQRDSAASPLMGELSWLMDAQPVKPERLSDEVQAALDVVQPLAAKNSVTLKNLITGDLPGLAIHSVALNQILVTLLGLAINQAGNSCVKVSARKLPVAVEIILKVCATSPSTDQGPEASTSLGIAGELARIGGGRLYLNTNDNSPFPIRLVLPALEQFPVLVVDDNEDSLQLFKRYAAGTRYNIVSSRDTDQIGALVESIRPRIIVLDIMMPKENGWIVLGRLRQLPLTAETPIIVCTILPQEKLALSLGASAYLKKPVSRLSFLQALDQEFALLEPEFL